MPTFSLLKKKRTKDSSGSKDPESPSSPTGNTPLTPTSSGGFNSSSTPPSSNPPSQNSSNKPDDQMLTHQTTQSTGQGPSIPQQLPGINSLVNPPQNEGAAQPQMDGSNGAEPGTNVPPAAAAPVVRTTKGKYSLGDFNIQRTLGTGSFGRVHLVQSKHNQRYYAVKVLKKAQVVRMKQVEHTNDERRMLQRVKHAFLITLWGTFQDAKNLYMVMDFVEGGELFSLLRKSQVSDQACCPRYNQLYTLCECINSRDESVSPTLSPSSTQPKSLWL